MKSASVRAVLVAGAAVLLAACAGRTPEISGDFGSIRAPDQTQIAEVGLKAGDTLVARRLQQEDDTVFALQLDYGIRPVPEDSIAWIRIRPRRASELGEPRHAALQDAAKDTAKDAAVASAVPAAMYLLFALPLVLLGIFVKGVLD